MVIYFGKESTCASVGGAERGGERIPSSFRAVSAEPDSGLHLTNQLKS